jgi:hypothetical protein
MPDLDLDTVRSQAEEQFLTFVSQPHRYPFGYRLDTFQLWTLCDGSHRVTAEHRFGCINPGVHIEIDLFDPAEPFVCSLGPWTLMTSADLPTLYEITVETIIPTVAAALIHLHTLGWPCHETCDCDPEEDDEELEQ